MAEGPRHILVVEDEAAHVELVRRAFAARPDPPDLEVVGTLAGARAALGRTRPDVVLADLVLPDGRATELLNGPAGTGPAVVVMTARGDEQAAVEALRAGALDYVVKSERTFAELPNMAARAFRHWRDAAEARRLRAEQAAHRRRLGELASELVAAGDRERRRIAEGLHDGLCQELALAKMKLESVGRNLAPGAEASAVRAVVEVLGRCIEQAETLAFDLSPPVLHQLGLPAAAEWLIERLGAAHGLRCRLECDRSLAGLGDVPRGALFRALKELLTNVVRHARAGEVEVRLAREREGVVLRVDDDGVGPAAATKAGGAADEGFGLLSLREQFARLGGHVTVGPSPLGGTRAEAFLPLPAAEQ